MDFSVFSWSIGIMEPMYDFSNKNEILRVNKWAYPTPTHFMYMNEVRNNLAKVKDIEYPMNIPVISLIASKLTRKTPGLINSLEITFSNNTIQNFGSY